MKKLCELEYGVSQWFYVVWLVLHLLLMGYATYEISISENLLSVYSMGSIILVIAIWIYPSIISLVHWIILYERNRHMAEYFKMLKKIGVRRDHENHRLNKSLQIHWFRISEVYLKNATFLIEYMWFIFTTVWLPITISYNSLRGTLLAFLVFGWAMLLVPLTMFSSIYKLVSVLVYIVLNIMIPWITIYFAVSIGFVSAIQFEFKQLQNNSSASCIDGQLELSGFLTSFWQTLFELIAMPSGLDTDLKNIRSVYCLFKDTESDYKIIVLITTYALISGLILLNMLIAIMSNTVTEAQRDKGWRQYRVSQALTFSVRSILLNF